MTKKCSQRLIIKNRSKLGYQIEDQESELYEMKSINCAKENPIQSMISQIEQLEKYKLELIAEKDKLFEELRQKTKARI